jgi:hypothetical protein
MGKIATDRAARSYTFLKLNVTSLLLTFPVLANVIDRMEVTAVSVKF